MDVYEVFKTDLLDTIEEELESDYSAKIVGDKIVINANEGPTISLPIKPIFNILNETKGTIADFVKNEVIDPLKNAQEIQNISKDELKNKIVPIICIKDETPILKKELPSYFSKAIRENYCIGYGVTTKHCMANLADTYDEVPLKELHVLAMKNLRKIDAMLFVDRQLKKENIARVHSELGYESSYLLVLDIKNLEKKHGPLILLLPLLETLFITRIYSKGVFKLPILLQGILESTPSRIHLVEEPLIIKDGEIQYLREVAEKSIDNLFF